MYHYQQNMKKAIDVHFEDYELQIVLRAVADWLDMNPGYSIWGQMDMHQWYDSDMAHNKASIAFTAVTEGTFE